MEALGKILLLILVVLVLPTALTWGGWWLVGLIPEPARDAIATLLPYGVALAVWGLLVYICGNIFTAIVD